MDQNIEEIKEGAPVQLIKHDLPRVAMFNFDVEGLRKVVIFEMDLAGF